jgi:translation initiation factor 2 subunit 1
VNAACEVCKKSIESAKGKLTVKEAARAVSERDDRLLAERMEALEAANREVSVMVWGGEKGCGVVDFCS